MTLPRTQCGACPWRDLTWMKDEYPEVVEAASDGAPVVCHTRMGPCPGPVAAGVTETMAEVTA